MYLHFTYIFYNTQIRLVGLFRVAYRYDRIGKENKYSNYLYLLQLTAKDVFKIEIIFKFTYIVNPNVC